jgi:hypothetical protein
LRDTYRVCPSGAGSLFFSISIERRRKKKGYVCIEKYRKNNLLKAISTTSFKALLRLASLAAATFSSALITKTLLEATEDCCEDLGDDKFCEEVAGDAMVLSRVKSIYTIY